MDRNNEIVIQLFQDGNNEPFGKDEIVDAWKKYWDLNYSQYGYLVFNEDLNIKTDKGLKIAPKKLQSIADIRNPDISFVLKENQKLLGCVEITTHSPDGSNVDKRYPLLWAANKQNCHAFIVCPYQKKRYSGQTNRLPHRHCRKNINFISEWRPDNFNSNIAQILPLKDLSQSLDSIPSNIRNKMLSFSDLGIFFANVLALELSELESSFALEKLNLFKENLHSLAIECFNATTSTNASSLIKLEKKWIQIYNLRPITGHWERGEGQFDSIDGRLMFTLDEIDDLSEAEKPNILEFWLPQMSKNHPWIQEQRNNGYGSKRLRNIMVHLTDRCTVKFVEDLEEEDWNILKRNRKSLLERLDSPPGIYRVFDITEIIGVKKLSGAGLSKRPKDIQHIKNRLIEKNLYFSTHRAYLPGWEVDFLEMANSLPVNSIVLVPRITSNLLENIKPSCIVIPAEECTKIDLLMLRQIERFKGVCKWLTREK